MEPLTKFEMFMNFISEKTPCWFSGHIFVREILSGEVIHLGPSEAKEYTCEKCGKKEMLT